MIGKLKDMTFNGDGTQNITITVGADFRETFDKLKDHNVSVDIKRYYKRRSLDANAYLWVLIGKIAEDQNVPKDEVYRKEVIEHGVYRVHCLQDDDVEEECEDWCSFGLGFQVETFASKIPGCTNVMFYKGSSYYDTKQMAKLIDGVIHEAESLGIPTINDVDKTKMLNKWEEKRAKVNHAD